MAKSTTKPAPRASAPKQEPVFIDKATGLPAVVIDTGDTGVRGARGAKGASSAAPEKALEPAQENEIPAGLTPSSNHICAE